MNLPSRTTSTIDLGPIQGSDRAITLTLRDEQEEPICPVGGYCIPFVWFENGESIGDDLPAQPGALGLTVIRGSYLLTSDDVGNLQSQVNRINKIAVIGLVTDEEGVFQAVLHAFQDVSTFGLVVPLPDGNLVSDALGLSN